MGDVHNSNTGTVRGDLDQIGRDKLTIAHHAPDPLAAVDELRAALASLGQTGIAWRTAGHELDAIERELLKRAPDKGEVRRRLTRFTGAVRHAGGFVASSTAIAEAVGIIAGWLGP
jgi:hypothetical protein